MDNENKLKAPKAVRGFKNLNMNFRTAETMNDKSPTSLIIPQKKGSCLNFKSTFLKEEKEVS